MGRASSLRHQGGFTLVELMASVLVLVIGMLAIVTVIQKGMGTTNLSRQRVAATNLVREITETARSADYARLTPAGTASELQSRNGALASTTGGTWTIRRGQTTYTVTPEVCTFDDPADRIAAAAAVPANKCANNPGGTTGDLNGDDFRRLTFTVQWTAGGEPQSFTQTALLANPAGGIGPRITSFPNAATVTGGSMVTFNVTTTAAGAVHWAADDGISSGDAIRTTGYTGWRIDWNIFPVGSANAVLDGTYTVTAQAFDDRGIAGDSKVATVTIDRSVPFAPAAFVGGHNTRDGDWVDLEWRLNAERDIIGYRVFWAGADGVVSGDDVRVCPATGAVTAMLDPATASCQHLNPVNDGATNYYVVAVDSSTQGDHTMLSIPGASGQPKEPETLNVSGTDAPTLVWTPPNNDSAASYRVYRDGTSVTHRVVRTPELTFTGANDGQAHQYWVSSVDSRFNESDLLGPVTWTP